MKIKRLKKMEMSIVYKIYVTTFNGDTLATFDDLNEAQKFYESNSVALFVEVWSGDLSKHIKTFSNINDYRVFVTGHGVKPSDGKEQTGYKETDEQAGVKPVDSNLKTLAALNKPKLSDVPPVALFALGAAMSDGASKYGRYNWRDTGTTASVFYDAMQRHLTDWYNGEDYAHDSKIHHLGHIMASCAILLDAELHKNYNDDRDKRNPESIARNPKNWKQV
jgi:hypothetical protein